MLRCLLRGLDPGQTSIRRRAGAGNSTLAIRSVTRYAVTRYMGVCK